MIVQVFLLKWKDGVSSGKIEELLDVVRGLKDKCDGISEIYVGENYSENSKGLTHGVVVLAENQEALDNYRKHSDHVAVAEEVFEIMDDMLGFDFKS